MTRVSFLAGAAGDWSIERIEAIRGETLAQATSLTRIESDEVVPQGKAVWTLVGVRSNERYLERAERERLARVEEGLGRPESRQAALIPIHKRDVWWKLAQDERREVLEGRSRHISIGSKYLPAIARRLYHARDLGGPFDFLTWFEFARGGRGRLRRAGRPPARDRGVAVRRPRGRHPPPAPRAPEVAARRDRLGPGVVVAPAPIADSTGSARASSSRGARDMPTRRAGP